MDHAEILTCKVSYLAGCVKISLDAPLCKSLRPFYDVIGNFFTFSVTKRTRSRDTAVVTRCLQVALLSALQELLHFLPVGGANEQHLQVYLQMFCCRGLAQFRLNLHVWNCCSSTSADYTASADPVSRCLTSLTLCVWLPGFHNQKQSYLWFGNGSYKATDLNK